MTLDLHTLTANWTFVPGEICARSILGRDGTELIQLRVDLGVMQMFPDGRPDGQRYRGFPTVLEFCQHELRLEGATLPAEEWRELEREVYQINYRRLALCSLMECALKEQDEPTARRHVARALRDIDACLERIDFLTQQRDTPLAGGRALRPTLVFHRGRLRAQAAILEGQYEAAIEAAEQGQDDLAGVLAELGLDTEQCQDDPGVQFLRRLSVRLRGEYEIPRTLREQMEDALAREDYEEARKLKDALRRRNEPSPGDEMDAQQA